MRDYHHALTAPNFREIGSLMSLMSAKKSVAGCLVVACALLVSLGACGGNGVDEVVCERDGVTLEEELRVVDVECGSGQRAERGMSVTVRYEASLADGSPISTGPGDGEEPYTFRLGAGQVVPAWDQGVVGMAVGGIRRIEAPPELAYGEAGLYPDVPPNAAVDFEVELLELQELED